MQIQMADGLQFSRVAWGFWRWTDWGLSIDELARLIPAVLERGITTIDHADGYAEGTAEEAFGDALAQNPALREKMQIITKCTLVYPWMGHRVKYYDTSEQYIVEQVEASLRKLRTDYIDLLLLHRPDPLMDPNPRHAPSTGCTPPERFASSASRTTSRSTTTCWRASATKS